MTGKVPGIKAKHQAIDETKAARRSAQLAEARARRPRTARGNTGGRHANCKAVMIANAQKDEARVAKRFRTEFA